MDLHLPKNKILLKNCIVIKLKQLELAEQTSAIQNEISYYENLRVILKADDTESLTRLLKDSHLKENYQTFNHHILTNSPKVIAEEYLDLTKSMMLEHGVYSEDGFRSLKQAFYKGNEDLISSDKTRNSSELEEEPDVHSFQNYLSQNQKVCLQKMDTLFHENNSKSISSAEFKAFSSQLKEYLLDLGKSKLEQTFEEEEKHLSTINITYDSSHSTYQIDFTFLESNDANSSQFVQTSALDRTTFYPSLCATYLEADDVARMDETLLDTNFIITKMNHFRETYQKLKEMMPKFKTKKSGHHIFYSAESDYAPSQELETICDSSIPPSEEELLI